MSENAIEVKHCSVRFDGFRLHISQRLCIPKGYVTGMIGRNGAGKTTLIRSILNLYRQAEGEILIFDKTMKNDGLEIKDQIGYVSDSFLFPQHYSAEQIGKRLGLFYSRYDDAVYHRLLRRLDVDPSKKAQACSEGTKAKISLAFALAIQPKLLILDEPTAHLDPVARRQVLDLLYETMQQEENTILFSTHITEDLDRIADYILYLEEGKVSFMLSKEELTERYQRIRVPQEAIPSELLALMKNRSETDGWIEGLCTLAQRFYDVPEAVMNRLSVEEIMIALDEAEFRV